MSRAEYRRAVANRCDIQFTCRDCIEPPTHDGSVASANTASPVATAGTSLRETSFNHANISFDAMGKEEVSVDSMELENSLPADADDARPKFTIVDRGTKRNKFDCCHWTKIQVEVEFVLLILLPCDAKGGG